jgi:hypothetical protein
MTGRLQSRRFRHRLFWCVGGVSALAAVVLAAIEIGNTGRSTATPIIDKPAQVYKEAPRMSLTADDRRDLLVTATRFIRTAVARKRLDSAWAMLGPEMKAGQTRKSWDTGFNNVIPFPAVGIADWNILYAYENDVAIDLGIVGSKKSDWAGKTFTIEFKRYTSSKHPSEWLVASWVPKGIGGAGQVRSVAAQPAPKPVKAAVSAKWLLLPLGILGFLIVSLATWGLSTIIRQRRAAKKYAKLLGYSTSGPGPS